MANVTHRAPEGEGKPSPKVLRGPLPEHWAPAVSASPGLLVLQPPVPGRSVRGHRFDAFPGIASTPFPKQPDLGSFHGIGANQCVRGFLTLEIATGTVRMVCSTGRIHSTTTSGRCLGDLAVEWRAAPGVDGFIEGPERVPGDRTGSAAKPLPDHSSPLSRRNCSRAVARSAMLLADDLRHLQIDGEETPELGDQVRAGPKGPGRRERGVGDAGIGVVHRPLLSYSGIRYQPGRALAL